MSERERNFYILLKSVLPSGFVIIPQVSVDKVLLIKAGIANRQAYLNRINRKSLDYVIFKEGTFTPVLAIELDDSSHLLNTRAIRDRFVNEACATANLPLLRIRVGDDLNENVVRKKVNEYLKLEVS